MLYNLKKKKNTFLEIVKCVYEFSHLRNSSIRVHNWSLLSFQWELRFLRVKILTNVIKTARNEKVNNSACRESRCGAKV